MWWNGRHWGLKIPCLAACGFESRHQHEESPGHFLHQEARSGLLLSSKKRQTAKTAWRSSRVDYFFCVSFFRNARMESGSKPFVGSFGCLLRFGRRGGIRRRHGCNLLVRPGGMIWAHSSVPAKYYTPTNRECNVQSGRKCDRSESGFRHTCTIPAE